jgi:preprotein translocase subunit SecA
MFNALLTSIFGSRNERLIKQFSKTVVRINALEAQMQALSDEALQAKTGEYKQRILNGEKLDQLLPEAFACLSRSFQARAGAASL